MPSEKQIRAEFDRWWVTSKYTQVIYASESEKQIALDAWQAATTTAAEQAEPAPAYNAMFETCEDGITGVRYVGVKRVCHEDDGSITVVIDYWPEPAPAADEEEIAKLIWERFAPAHEVEWPSGNAGEYRQVAKDIVGKFRP